MGLSWASSKGPRVRDLTACYQVNQLKISSSLLYFLSAPQAIMAYIKQRTEESDAKHAQNSAAAAAAAAAATAAAVAASSAAAQPAAAAPPLTPGAVKLVFGEEEFDAGEGRR
jgi:hypothetical protein